MCVIILFSEGVYWEHMIVTICLHGDEFCGDEVLWRDGAKSLQPIMWLLVKQLFISQPLWSICYPSCVCMSVCTHACACTSYPTVPHPSGLLVVLKGGITTSMQSWLIVSYCHTHTQNVPSCAAAKRKKGRINLNWGVPGERPGLLEASL